MHDGSKTDSEGGEQPEGRMAGLWRRMWEWRVQQHLARGLAYGVGSGAVSLLLLWVQIRY
ncbi:hypothetical protein ACFY9S_39550 [Streptomyces sp. NPDC012474]|uniref:hypothetical protein n=1 Tax=Streptomyces sp. NPDC012474 TaxID=3364836 RepID=UPI0036E85358